jgi:hypothetical protein
MILTTVSESSLVTVRTAQPQWLARNPPYVVIKVSQQESVTL